MPSAAARRLYEDQLPSFMSIIDTDSDSFDDRSLVTVVDPKLMEMDPSCAANLHKHAQPQYQHHLRPLPSDASHRHHDSTSTQNSESADSSPTTTLTTDTSSLSDPSPSSSPDSPINLIPLSSFPGTSFGGVPTTTSSNAMASNNLTVTHPEPQLMRPMTSPSPRRPRNMKGLSIQPPFAGSPPPTNMMSEPSSPSFIKPQIPGMKRKPSQLSLKTNTSDLNIRPATLEIPSSPGLGPILQRRALKHSTSSPHMLSGMKSATFGPAGGMTFPTVLERGQSGLSEVLRPTKAILGPSFDSTIVEEPSSPIKSQVANRAAFDFEDCHENENNEDQKSPGYPDGPVAIYDDNVYLYLEPTAEEAAKFDVVINVAREVVNPFKAKTKEQMGPSKAEVPAAESPIPDTALTTDSYATAFEYPPSDDRSIGTPTTPKASNLLREPEYIHMPWDHNTDIATDLMTLCEIVEKRTKEGKKVLIHCQQGASRSASLIIAYGMYKDPTLSVNDSYYAAQAKSRWISPNMRLMYCLQDFQKEVAKRKLPPRSAAGSRNGRSPTKHRLTLSVDAIDIKPKEPLTAPLPGEEEDSEKSASPSRSPVHSRGKSTPNLEAISPGPSSAPSSFSWSQKDGGKDTDKAEGKDRGKPEHFDLEKLLNPPKFFQPDASPEPESPPRPSSNHLFRTPPPTLRPRPSLNLRPPPSLGFQPPQSPGFPPESSSFFRPPPSPGFGAHRFGQPETFGFSSLNIVPNSHPTRSLSRSFEERNNKGSSDQQVTITREMPDDDALMSPRAETMTNNPLHDSFSELAGMKFVEVPPTPDDPGEALFSPRETMFPRDPFFPFGRPTQVTDPRSPPTKGETPIVRSIDDLL